LECEEISEIAQQWLFHHAVFGAVDAERGRAIDLMRGEIRAIRAIDLEQPRLGLMRDAIRGHQGN
jgi:hypothetical protein